MPKLRYVVLAGVLAAGAFAVPDAHADWRHRGGGYHHRGYGGGAVVGGALLGLGLGAALGAVIAPPVIYAPPPIFYYPPPAAYYPPPPVVYYQAPRAPQGYWPQEYRDPVPTYAVPQGWGGGGGMK